MGLLYIFFLFLNVTQILNASTILLRFMLNSTGHLAGLKFRFIPIFLSIYFDCFSPLFLYKI